MHQWLFDHRHVVLVICLLSMAWSGFLYRRAWLQHQATRQRPLRRRRRAAETGSKKPSAPKPHEPLPRTTSIKGEQGDLLAAVTEKDTAAPSPASDAAYRKRGYQSTHIIRQPATPDDGPAGPPRPSEIIRQLQSQQAEASAEEAEIGAHEADDADDTDAPPYSTSDKFRTTRHMEAPSQAPSEIDQADDAESTLADAAPTEERESWRQDQQSLRALADEERQRSGPLPEEPGSDRAIHRGYQPPSEAARSALDKAQRLEELGLHIGISPADLARVAEQVRAGEDADEGLRAIAEQLPLEDRQRLSELGLVGEDTANGERLITEQLDGILARLDEALGEDDDPTPIPEASEDDDGLQPEEDGDPESPSVAPPRPTVAPVEDLPSWARADSFDEDLPVQDDDDESQPGTQRSLFE